MKLNRGGLIACGIYLGAFVILLGLEFLADANGAYLLGLLAVFPAAIVLYVTGLHRLIPPDSWLSSAYVALVLSFLISYLVGWLISGLLRAFNRADEHLFSRSDKDA